MKCEINIPNFGYFSNLNVVVEIAKEAKDTGWDGFSYGIISMENFHLQAHGLHWQPIFYSW